MNEEISKRARSSVRKGKQWEREVASMFGDALGVTVRRTGFMQSQDQGQAPDVDAAGVFWIECKVGIKPPVARAYDQASRHAPPSAWPIAVIKKLRRPPYVAISKSDWKDFLNELADRGYGDDVRNVVVDRHTGLMKVSLDEFLHLVKEWRTRG